MRRLCVICEGSTEVEFVKRCLQPHLFARGLLVYSTLLQARSGGHRGGRVTVERLGGQIASEYAKADRLTTLVDFYGFQDRDHRSRAQLEADILAEAVKRNPRLAAQHFVLPYVQMHEFEGLLFSDVDQFRLLPEGWSDKARNRLKAIRAAFANPEEINDSPETAPSKQIQQVFANGGYSKTEHGPLIAEAIGLEAIRAVCPQFNEWLSKLEAWGAE